jgi:hypothetical protein
VAKTLKYTGESQKLVRAGKVEGGVLEYSLDGEDFNDAVPEAVDVGDYTVYYRAKGDDNHKDSEVMSVSASIQEADDRGLADKTFGDFSGLESFVLDAGDKKVSVSVKGCQGMNMKFELKAKDGGYVIVSSADNYGRTAEFDLSFDKEGNNVAANVTCEEYHSKYENKQ